MALTRVLFPASASLDAGPGWDAHRASRSRYDPAMGNPPRRHDEPGLDRRAELNRRLRAAFVEGAEEDSRRLGRGLTEEELKRVDERPRP